MTLLLDENLPIKLKHRFKDKGIDAYTLKDMQWLGKKNGELLELMLSSQFDVFVTVDNNLSFQQNFKRYPIAVLVLIAKDNTYETIMEFFDLIIASLQEKFIGPKAVIHPAYYT